MDYLPLTVESPVPSDLDIAKRQTPKDIKQLAREIHLHNNELELYGTKKAKVKLNVLERLSGALNGKYVVVSGITPTPLGESRRRSLPSQWNFVVPRRRQEHDDDRSLSSSRCSSEEECHRMSSSAESRSDLRHQGWRGGRWLRSSDSHG